MNRCVLLIIITLNALVVEVYGQQVPQALKPFVVHFSEENRNWYQKWIKDFDGFDRSIAIIMGVSEYHHFVRPQQSQTAIKNDLSNMTSYLRDLEGFDEIIVLRDEQVNLDNLQTIQAYLVNAVKQQKVRLFFAYSGRGFQDEDHYYLLKSSAWNDTDKTNTLKFSYLKFLVDEVAQEAHQTLFLINSFGLSNFRSINLTNGFDLKEYSYHLVADRSPDLLDWHNPELGSGTTFYENFFNQTFNHVDLGAEGGVSDQLITMNEFESKHLDFQVFDVSLNGSKGSFYLLDKSLPGLSQLHSNWEENQHRQVSPEQVYNYKAKLSIEHKNYERAYQLFKKAASLGDLEAIFHLGWLYWNGLGIYSDKEKAYNLYLSAAEQGLPEAMTKIGLIEMKSGNCKDALVWLDKAAKYGVKDAIHSLGVIYYYYSDCADHELGYKWISMSANQGDPDSKYHLAISLMDTSFQVPKDSCMAFTLLEKVASNDYVPAMAPLADLYFNGTSQIEVDYDLALYWAKLAVERGSDSILPRIIMAKIYRYGKSIETDYKEALKWYKEAADLNSVEAMFAIGQLFLVGEYGLEKDCIASVEWVRKAVQHQHPEATWLLASMYWLGFCVDEDLDTSSSLFLQSNLLGYTPALTGLGNVYREKKNYELSAKYYFEAVEAGESEAEKKLQDVIKIALNTISYENKLTIIVDKSIKYRFLYMDLEKIISSKRNLKSIKILNSVPNQYPDLMIRILTSEINDVGKQYWMEQLSLGFGEKKEEFEKLFEKFRKSY